MKPICKLLIRNLYNSNLFFAGIKLLRKRVTSTFYNDAESKADYLNQIEIITQQQKALIRKNKLFYKNKISIAEITALENSIKYNLFQLQAYIEMDLLFI